MTDNMTNPARESSDLSVSEAGDAFLKLFDQEESATDARPTSEQLEEEEPQVEEEETEEEEVEESEEDSSDDQPEAESDEEESTTETDDDGFIIELDGEQLTEAQLREIKQSGMLESDYRRKTQALAEEKRQWEEQKAQEEAQMRKQWEEKLAIASSAVADELAEFQDIDWDMLRAEDPIEYQSKWIDFQRAQTKAKAMQDQIQEALKQEQAGYQQRSQEFINEQMDIVREKLPELKDPEKAKTLTSELMTYMIDRGFTQDEVNNLATAREILLIHDAMQWQKLQEKGGKEAKKVKKKTKVIRPGSGAESAQAAKAQKAAEAKSKKLERFKQRGGKQKDAAELFLELGLVK